MDRVSGQFSGLQAKFEEYEVIAVMKPFYAMCYFTGWSVGKVLLVAIDLGNEAIYYGVKNLRI